MKGEGNRVISCISASALSSYFRHVWEAHTIEIMLYLLLIQDLGAESRNTENTTNTQFHLENLFKVL